MAPRASASRTPWSVYILRCADGSLYTGATNDLERRLVLHDAGKGARYTRSRRPVSLVYAEPAGSRGRALSREAALKGLSRGEKLALVGRVRGAYTAPVTSPFDRRLRHIVTRSHLATMLVPTYAAALDVDDEEAHERLAQAVQDSGVQDDLYFALTEALKEKVTARLGADALLDKLSAAVEARVGRVRAATATPGVSAVMVRLNLAAGIAPDTMRAMLESDKGRALVFAGLHELGRHFVKELFK